VSVQHLVQAFAKRQVGERNDRRNPGCTLIRLTRLGSDELCLSDRAEGFWTIGAEAGSRLYEDGVGDVVTGPSVAELILEEVDLLVGARLVQVMMSIHDPPVRVYRLLLRQGDPLERPVHSFLYD
jgi:hypothetical protein